MCGRCGRSTFAVRGVAARPSASTWGTRRSSASIAHDKPGHWHGGGYDKSGSPGNSHRDFPKGIETVVDQVDWSLRQVSERTAELLAEADHAEAADLVDATMLQTAISQIRSHLDQQGDLRGKAISAGIIEA